VRGSGRARTRSGHAGTGHDRITRESFDHQRWSRAGRTPPRPATLDRSSARRPRRDDQSPPNPTEGESAAVLPPVDDAVLAIERPHDQASDRGSCPARPQGHEPADYRLSLRDSVPCSLSDASPGRHPERRIRARHRRLLVSGRRAQINLFGAVRQRQPRRRSRLRLQALGRSGSAMRDRRNDPGTGPARSRLGIPLRRRVDLRRTVPAPPAARLPVGRGRAGGGSPRLTS
jgi:hypothetical protein